MPSFFVHRNHPPASVILLLLTTCLCTLPQSLPTPWLSHPAMLLVVGLFVVGLCATVPSVYAVPFGLFLVLTWTLVMAQRHSAPGYVSRTRATHVSSRASPSIDENNLREGFANATTTVQSSLSKQQEATHTLNKTMQGAKVNATAIAKAMDRFKDIHYRKTEYQTKMDKVKKSIEAFREKYTNPTQPSTQPKQVAGAVNASVESAA